MKIIIFLILFVVRYFKYKKKTAAKELIIFRICVVVL